MGSSVYVVLKKSLLHFLLPTAMLRMMFNLFLSLEEQVDFDAMRCLPIRCVAAAWLIAAEAVVNASCGTY